MADIILLRKLTLKSKLNFGKYQDETIEHLINRKGYKAINYLRWVYFTSSKISFIESVLVEVLKIENQELHKGDVIIFASVGGGMHINAIVYKY